MGRLRTSTSTTRCRWHYLIALLGCILSLSNGQRSAPCASDATITGYSSLEDINLDMADELASIGTGAITPQPQYQFILCPQTTFNGQQTLLPVLNQSLFTCGLNGDATDNCIVSGGDVQVLIRDSTIETYALGNVGFSGITFTAFGQISIGAFASNLTTATFANCNWLNFTSVYAIRLGFESQGGDNSTRRMLVDVSDSIVMGGSGGTVFSNDQGDLTIHNLMASNLDMQTVVASGNGGISTITASQVSASMLSSVTFATSGGINTVLYMDVFENSQLRDVFYSEFVGSETNLDTVNIRDNVVSGTDSWSGVFVSDGSSAKVDRFTMRGNTNVIYGVIAQLDSTAVINDVEMSNNVGVAPNVSAPVFVISDSSIDMQLVSLLDNQNFTSAIFAIFRSFVSITDSCIVGGSSDAVVFVGDGSNYASSGNYIANHQSDACDAPGERLFKEDPASDCFQGGNQCTGTCLPVANATVCATGLTAAPFTPLPTVLSSPTVAPSMLPNATAAPTTASTGTFAPTTASTGTFAPTTASTGTFAPTTSSNGTLAPTIVTDTSAPTYTPTLARKSSKFPSSSQSPSSVSGKTGKGNKGKGQKGKKGGKSKDGSGDTVAPTNSAGTSAPAAYPSSYPTNYKPSSKGSPKKGTKHGKGKGKGAKGKSKKKGKSEKKDKKGDKSEKKDNKGDKSEKKHKKGDKSKKGAKSKGGSSYDDDDDNFDDDSMNASKGEPSNDDDYDFDDDSMDDTTHHSKKGGSKGTHQYHHKPYEVSTATSHPTSGKSQGTSYIHKYQKRIERPAPTPLPTPGTERASYLRHHGHL